MCAAKTVYRQTKIIVITEALDVIINYVLKKKISAFKNGWYTFLILRRTAMD